MSSFQDDDDLTPEELAELAELVDQFAQIEVEVRARTPDWFVDALCQSVKAQAQDGFSLADLVSRYGWQV